MAKLIYQAICSLDGYVEDRSGSFGWAQPDEEVHRLVNDRHRLVGTHLYGRRMYETMTYWETAPTGPEVPDVVRDWTEIWRSAHKVVYSTTLDAVSSANTRIERVFDPQALSKLKEASLSDLSVGGAELAGKALSAGLVDEVELLLVPVVVGGGKPALSTEQRIALELIDTRRFASGVVDLHYRTKR